MVYCLMNKNIQKLVFLKTIFGIRCMSDLSVLLFGARLPDILFWGPEISLATLQFYS